MHYTMVTSTKKRGQTMTLFLLLGIVLVAVVGFMLFLRGGLEDTGVEDITDLELSTTSFKAHAHQCLKQEVLNAVDKYGVLDGQEPYIGAYVRRNLPRCIEWDFYEEQGFAVTAGTPAVDVEITRDTLLIDVGYLIEGEDQRGQFSFEELYFYLPRGASGLLAFDGADLTKDEVSVPSTDGDAELIIPEGTEVKDADGNLVDEIKLRVLERDFNGLANPLIVGMVAYEITPHVTFSQPVTLKVTYREQDIPGGVDEGTLRLAQFERDYNMWFSVPTTVDEEKNTLTASFTHFSVTAPVVRCGVDDPSTLFELPLSQLFPSGEVGSQNYVFIQDCGTIDECELIKAEAWATTDDNLFEDDGQEIGDLVLKPVFEEDELVDPEKPLNQVPLSSCVINDWDEDDQIDTTEQVSPICMVGGESVDLSQCPDPDKNLMLEECLSGIQNADKWQERIDALEAQEKKAGRDVPNQDGILDEKGGCGYAINEEGNKADIDNPVGVVQPTPNTYGYLNPDKETFTDPYALPGGFGVLRFRFAGNGAACIALDGDGKPLIELSVVDDKGNAITDWKLNPYFPNEAGEEPRDSDFIHLAPPLDINTGKPVEDFEVDPEDVKAAWDAWNTLEGSLNKPETLRYQETGYNEIYIRVENTDYADGDACVQAEVTDFTITGAGIAFDVVRRETDRCIVTVQERINYLCGCDRDCEGESWYNTELGILANWRGEWNPVAGSIVNGQTLLCHLDPNDAKMKELYEIQPDWSPFGGCCAGGVCVAEMEMASIMVDQPCTVLEATACDYRNNRIVECSGISTTGTTSVESDNHGISAEVIALPKITGMGGTLPDDDDGAATESGTDSSGLTWRPKKGCGEDTCRIVGSIAQCVGADQCETRLVNYFRLEEGECTVKENEEMCVTGEPIECLSDCPEGTYYMSLGECEAAKEECVTLSLTHFRLEGGKCMGQAQTDMCVVYHTNTPTCISDCPGGAYYMSQSECLAAKEQCEMHEVEYFTLDEECILMPAEEMCVINYGTAEGAECLGDCPDGEYYMTATKCSQALLAAEARCEDDSAYYFRIVDDECKMQTDDGEPFEMCVINVYNDEPLECIDNCPEGEYYMTKSQCETALAEKTPCKAAGGDCHTALYCEDMAPVEDGGHCSKEAAKEKTDKSVCCKAKTWTCDDDSKCEDWERKSGETSTEWGERCSNRGCSLDCHAWGKWCVPADIETDPEKSCGPTSDIKLAGVPNDLRLCDDGKCRKCAKVFSGGGSVAIWTGKWEWQVVESILCGCEHPVSKKDYDIGKTAWFEGPICKECKGMEKWEKAEGECTGFSQKCRINPYGGVGIQTIYPGDDLCLGQKTEHGTSYYISCIVDADEAGVSDKIVCKKGCNAGDTINPSTDCHCTSATCPQCPMTTTVPKEGMEVGDTKVSDKTCYVCNADGYWVTSGDCFCPLGEGPSNLLWTNKEPSDTLYWKQSQQKCWQCTQEEFEPAAWKEKTGTSGKRQCADSKCTIDGVDVLYHQYVCIEGEPKGEGYYDIKRCIGKNNWDNQEGCALGCDNIGQTFDKVPSTC